MPILDLQRRMRQLGEIRIGHVVDTGRTRRDGKPLMRPAKLDKFRFTSPSRQILEQVAALYGGEVKPWTPANGGPAEFEVYSTADRLPVLVPPRDAVSQWYELYQGSKCVRRCDGRTELKSDRTCLCDPAARDCSITTRVNVMLRDVPALGQWLLISKGYYAGVELPPAAELLAQAGGYVAGWLGMEEKLVQREQGPARFMVPTLDVEITPAALMSGQITGQPQAVVTGPERVAITSGRPDYAALAAVAKTTADVRALYEQAVANQHMDKALADALTARANELKDKQDNGQAPPVEPDDPAEEVIEPEFVDDDDPSEIWMQVMAAAGRLGWTTDQTETAFAERNGGVMPGSAETGQLREFVTFLKNGARA
ncbi:hypothetical protein [Peterkaempfera sp. SMS 1(5)a]|uniref:recombination directionality factor n=1 Tax=Peterkaempfera podocarpi TaxID=3232308 RepID=UPI00366F644B